MVLARWLLRVEGVEHVGMTQVNTIVLDSWKMIRNPSHEPLANVDIKA